MAAKQNKKPSILWMMFHEPFNSFRGAIAEIDDLGTICSLE